MSIHPTGFVRGEATAGVPRASRVALATSFAAFLVLAGCASPYPAPIVHREPPGAVVARPAPAAPAGVAAAAVPAPSEAAGPAAGAAPGVQTRPIARGPVESRPLPGTGTGVVATGASGIDSANLLRSEPSGLKQRYSDAAAAQMRAEAPPAVPPIPPVASAAPSAAAVPSMSSDAPAAVAGAQPDAGGWIWPASGKVVQDFAQPGSMGLSIAGKSGDPVVAVNDGRVIFSGAGPRSYGNLIIVKHGDDTLSVYAHNRALLVKEGQSVQRGQRIAELGSSGTDSPKLHFEVRRDGRPIDPRTVLPAR